MKLQLIFALVYVAFLSVTVFANQKLSLRSATAASEPYVTTSAEELKRIVSIARSLENAPFARGANGDREWALYQLDHDPEICPHLRGTLIPTIEESGPDWQVIYGQFIVSFVAFQIEHPDRRNDIRAVYTAALTSCVRVYLAALERDSANHIAHLEKANEHDRNGTLAQFIEDNLPYYPPAAAVSNLRAAKDSTPEHAFKSAVSTLKRNKCLGSTLKCDMS
jgi:hypothetical protein